MQSILHHHYHAPRLQGITELFWAHGIRSLAENLVVIFIPIYLYQLGYTLSQIFEYLLLGGIFWIFLIYPMMRLINRFGATRLMVISMVGNVMQFLLLLTLPTYHWPLWIIAFAWAWYTSIYWPAFRGAFAANLAHRRTGRLVGVWSSTQMLAVGVAPAVGGLVATEFGIDALYIASIALFVVAAAPLFGGPTFVRNQPFKLSWRKLKKYRSDFIANLAETYNDGTLNQTWPLFVFFVIPSYAGVGLLSSVLILTSIVVSLYVGTREETKGVRHYVNEGATINGLGHFLRVFTISGSHVFAINLASGVGYSLYHTAFNTTYYENIERRGLPYLFMMQLVSAVAWIIAFGLLLVLTLLLPGLAEREVLLAGILFAIPMSYLITKIR
ncbi:MAG: MFS transporter [Patescibacteria group bacterium]